MKTTSTAKNLVEEKLQEAHQMLDELVLQLALGKAEVADKYEEIKKEFSSKISQWKGEFKNSTFISALNAALEEPAPTQELTLEQKIDKIFNTLSSFESEIKADHQPKNKYIFYDLEVFKLKLEILRLRLKVKKFDITQSFRTQMGNAKDFIGKINHQISDELKDGRKKIAHISDDAHEAFNHLRKAIRSLH
jgi:hypothetical protein